VLLLSNWPEANSAIYVARHQQQLLRTFVKVTTNEVVNLQAAAAAAARLSK
jgi:hypothetical protein